MLIHEFVLHILFRLLILSFYCQARNRKEEANKIYERLIETQSTEFDPTLVYIQYMKFKRRTESIKAARAVFKRARQDQRIQHHCFTAAALMEYYCSKVNIKNVFYGHHKMTASSLKLVMNLKFEFPFVCPYVSFPSVGLSIL